MRAETRRFPRIRCRLEGAIEVIVPGAEPDEEPVWIELPAVALSLTCEGVGLRLLSSQRPDLARGAAVTLRLGLGERWLELPGEVAWYRARADPAQACDLGIRLRLEATECGSTLVYSNWIVEHVGRSMNREMALGVVLLQVARLSLDTLDLALVRRRKSWRPVGEVLLEMNAITTYELRVAQSCHLPCEDESIPASLLAWRQSLAL